ncbi:conserved secreted protein [marine actinobacterium PHSC20C1]|nr:conserved secreted protein [marine actinobacterium PHSC20C1]
MRGLNVCVLGPAALIVTAVIIALTPLVGTAAATDAAGMRPATNDATLAVDAATCQISDAEIIWGVKESLRSYISGTIANGEWAVSDGATYETPDFGWAAGSGQLDDGNGSLTFDGTLRFTGHDGILDTTLTNLSIVFDGSTTAILVLDVFGTTQDGTPVDESGVEFVSIDISDIDVADGTARLDAAQTMLTEDGSAAFGTYPAGEKFDPLSLKFSATADCMPQPQPPVTALARNLMVSAGVLVVALGAGVVFLVTRRRGTSSESESL